MDKVIGACSGCGSEEFAIEYNPHNGETYVYCRNCLWPTIRIDKDGKGFAHYKKEARSTIS